MRVLMLVPSVLRGDAGGASKLELTVRPEASLGDLFDTVAETHPKLERRIRDEQGQIRRYVNVFVDGDESRHLGGLAAPLRDGAEVQVLPSVAGG
ncbi:MAG: molybdopterin synthase sulfur carrier subunit [Micromonosporaceae bacterium]|nr:molybdopterin synthase sulfur carrier subunit [Micromonosporaceae bacterium]